MARKHAFPLIESGLKVVDNDVLNSLGDGQDISLGAWNANEDKNVEWFVTSDGGLGTGWLYSDKKDHKVLIDFNENPADVYSELSNPVVGGQIVHPLAFRFGQGHGAGVSGEIDVELKLDPGSVFCVGVKNKVSHMIVQQFFYYFASSDISGVTAPFGDLGDPSYSADIDVEKWITFMFDGKRFVYMGSNNWC